MATLYIAEFRGQAYLGTQAPQVVGVPPLVEQTLAIGASSVQSNAFSADTNIIQLSTDSVCSVAFGPNPTASATNMRLAANETRYFVVSPLQKVAVITNS